jgi:ribosomal protection tetracycline resistance protein
VQLGRGEEKVTAIQVFDRGLAEQRRSIAAGQIGKVWGLGESRVGDALGAPWRTAVGHEHQFAPPTLETVVTPRHADDKARLRLALTQLAEQDPLIDVRQDDERREFSVSLYGEVQKEVIQATLADDFGLEAEFGETTTICVERPARAGEAVEILHAESNPFRATIGLRVDPGAEGSGVEFRVAADPLTIPLYLYKTHQGFAEHMNGHVADTLCEGVFGWQVTDCVVTMTRCGYSVPDGPPSRRGPLSTPADFKKLLPMVLMQALACARTTVCEPFLRGSLEVPVSAIGAVMAVLARLGASVDAPAPHGELCTIEAVLPAARATELQRQLPGLTAGEGAFESEFAGYRPVAGEPPTRRRTTASPLSREEYLLRLARRATGPSREPRTPARP